MYLVDWIIVAIPILIVAVATLYSHRYLKSVVDFTSSGRVAGRYMLSTARSEMGAGAIGYVAMFEWFSHGGFPIPWWNQIATPVGLILAISGFVVYRYRQTRALTLAQFFEMRYSRRFRLATGLLGFIAGILNFGVIPVIGGKFMVHFLDLPQSIHFLSFSIPTYILLMGLFLTITTLIAITGGQITIMVTDCLQGMISQVFYVIIGLFLLITFNWTLTREMLLSYPPGHSMVNPFDSFSNSDFNIWYVLMLICTNAYGTMAWQNNQGFNSSAASPHESRMGYILGTWRGFAIGTSMLLLAVSSMTYLHQPAGAAIVHLRLADIADPQTAKQMLLPLGLAQILPIGIKGVLVSLVLMGIFGGDGQHLHSWGSIFFQDIVLPLLKHSLTPRMHIIFLRLSIIGVALFAFLFGAFFTQTEYLPMWFGVTTAIFVGGAGAAILGGLYWSRGTTAGAWSGLIIGSVLSTGGILLRQPSFATFLESLFGAPKPDSPMWMGFLLDHVGPRFPLNGTQISFTACLLALSAYIVVSLLTCRTPHNMDLLLHRGKYAVEPEASDEPIVLEPARKQFHLYNLVGIDRHFTPSDRWATLGIFFWSVFWFMVFLIGSTCYLIHPWSNLIWADYWLVVGIYLPFVLAILTTIWFTVGCWNDLVQFFRRLRVERPEIHDDGKMH